MATAKSRPLAGSTIHEYTNVNIEALNRKELAQITSKLASAANKRIKRSAELTSANPFTGNRPTVEFKPEHFSVAGKDIHQLRAEYQRVKAYLEDSENKPKTPAKVPKWQQTIETIGPEDLNRFTRKELQAVVASLETTVNRRVKNLQKMAKDTGVKAPALKAFEDAGPLIGTKGLTLNELRNRYRRAADFLQMKTSTVQGYKDFEKSFKDMTGFEFGDKRVSTFWDAFEKAKEEHPAVFASRKNVYEVFADVLKERLRDNGEATAEEVYEQLKDRLDILIDKAVKGEDISGYGNSLKWSTLSRARGD